MGVIDKSTAMPRVETSSVKSEPVDVVDIESKLRNVVAINSEQLD